MSAQDRQLVAARAAVAGIDQVARNIDEASNNTFAAKENVRLGAVLALLPPGVSAAAIGRSALIPNVHHWAESGLGARQDVHFKAPVWTYQILFWAGRERAVDRAREIPGPVDIPVWADPGTGEIVHVDVDRMVAELEPQFALGKAIWKDEDAPLAPVRSVLKSPRMAKGLLEAVKAQIVDVVDDIKAIGDTGAPPPGERPSDAAHPPVEGVGYQAWVTIRGRSVMDAVHPTHLEAYTTHRGCPPGRWAEVDQAWEARAAADPHLAAWRAFDIARLSVLGSRW